VNERQAIEKPPVDDPTESLAAAVTNPVGAFTLSLRRGLQAARTGLVLFYNSENLTFASSIAYYTLLSLFPFLLFVFSVLGRLAVDTGADGPNLADLVARALPSRFDFLTGQLDQLARAPIELGVVGTLLTLWASMGVFGAVTSAVNHSRGVERNYRFLKHKI
jgi:membrane protein